jgi:hypothetical protein
MLSKLDAIFDFELLAANVRKAFAERAKKDWPCSYTSVKNLSQEE